MMGEIPSPLASIIALVDFLRPGCDLKTKWAP